MKDLGELIRAARVAKGVTLEQASAATRIRRTYLDAIEDGDFRIFPGTAYATGFLRNYAFYLGLNPDEILQTFHAISPPSGISITPATTVGVERLRRRSRRRALWTAIAVMTLGLSVYGIKEYSDGGSAAPVRTPPPSSLTSGDLGGPSDRNADQVPSHVVRPFAVIRVDAVHTAWVRILKGRRQVYWGPINTGTSKSWRGKDVKLRTSRGPVLKVWVDGTRAWRVSKTQGRVVLIAGPYTWHRKH